MASFKLTTLLVTVTFLGLGICALSNSQSEPSWLTLPPTPKLPGSPKGVHTTVNGVKIWHAEFGDKSSSKLPVLMLHNGLGNSDYWGDVVELVAKKHYVIVMDARGQGRSPLTTNENMRTFFKDFLNVFSNDNLQMFSYEQYARDAGMILENLQIPKAAWVGWDDGANTVLAALMDPKLARMVDRAFTTGAWHHVLTVNHNYRKTLIFDEFNNRTSDEYKAFQPTGNLKALRAKWSILQETRPLWGESDLAKISLASKLTLSWGEHEEAVDSSEMKLLPGYLKDSKVVIMPNVSHFAPLQDPDQFANALETFLE